MRRDGWAEAQADHRIKNGGSDASVLVSGGFVMNIEANFIALVPSFKFERSPMFVSALDAVGLRWLRDGFLELVDADAGASFVIGDGAPIASDDRCKLIAVKARTGQASKILPIDQSNFAWDIGPTDAASFADQLSSLLFSNIPGHQYLELERGNYRAVVVTKHEYPVDTIRAMRDGRAPGVGGP
jgi:hypothetical protein